jgi:hypothetical protein
MPNLFRHLSLIKGIKEKDAEIPQQLKRLAIASGIQEGASNVIAFRTVMPNFGCHAEFISASFSNWHRHNQQFNRSPINLIN